MTVSPFEEASFKAPLRLHFLLWVIVKATGPMTPEAAHPLDLSYARGFRLTSVMACVMIFYTVIWHGIANASALIRPSLRSFFTAEQTAYSTARE